MLNVLMLIHWRPSDVSIKKIVGNIGILFFFFNWEIFEIFFCSSEYIYIFVKNSSILQNCLLFTILRLFGTKKSIRWKVDHGGQIVFWYLQHATNLAKATMFVVSMSSIGLLVWVRGKAEQKRSLTFCVFGQARSRCSSSSTFPKSQLRQNFSTYGTPFHAPNTTSSCVLPHRNRARTFRSWHSWCHTSSFHSHMTYPWSASILSIC
jgi:hypothetical protein